MNWTITILISVAAFAFGWWAGRRSVRVKLGEIKDKVEAGKENVQRAINRLK